VAPGSLLALDLGGTQVRAAAVSPEGVVTGVRRAQTPVADGPRAIEAACVRLLRGVASEVPVVAAVGISSAGPVDPWRGVVTDPPNLGPVFRDVPLASVVEEALGVPTFLDRDTQLAAVGEGTLGAARGSRDFIYVTISTGLGGAVVSGGRLLRGPDGTAGELGHLTVDLDGPACGCGARGHLEAIASGRAIASAGEAAARSGASPLLAARLEATGTAGSLSARDVAEASDAGDAAAGAILERAFEAFAAAAVSLVDVFNPERIVVGGSLAEAMPERFFEPARAAIAAHAFRDPGRRVRIVRAALGPDVSLVGAAVAAAVRAGIAREIGLAPDFEGADLDPGGA
jgi:glucokinase